MPLLKVRCALSQLFLPFLSETMADICAHVEFLDPDVTCRRKAAFLIEAIFQHAQQPEQLYSQAAAQSSLIADLINSLSPATIEPFGADGDLTDDEDLQEKAASALNVIVQRIGARALPKAERERLASTLQQGGLFGFTQSEKDALLASLQ